VGPRNEVTLAAFDLIELQGDDLRKEPNNLLIYSLPRGGLLFSATFAAALIYASPVSLGRWRSRIIGVVMICVTEVTIAHALSPRYSPYLNGAAGKEQPQPLHPPLDNCARLHLTTGRTPRVCGRTGI
jgi:hypothetical protein